MKLLHIVAAGGLFLSLSAPALAQMGPGGDAGMHRNDPGRGPGGEMRGGHDMGHGPEMHGNDMRRVSGEHRDWRGDRAHCRTVWRHHHRVRRCMR